MRQTGKNLENPGLLQTAGSNLQYKNSKINKYGIQKTW
jgi:hypothetical protein